jgi:hypothetical protein
VHSENNGIVYSCRGGFLDIAHVRDYADTALYTIASTERLIDHGGSFAMPDEGAKIHVEIDPVARDVLRQQGRWAVAIPLGQYVAFQSSVWHEIATWFGWSTFRIFPERVSSFSPEDLYSNVLGARIAAAVISERGARDEFTYNRSVDRWLDLTLALAETVPRSTAEEAMRAVDGLWWDSDKRIPDMSLVLRRYFDVGDRMEPWLVPPRLAGPRLRQACGPEQRPLVVQNPSELGGIDFSRQATLVIDLPPELASLPAFRRLGPRITQRDFPALLAVIRAENRDLFGDSAATPEPGEP